MAVIIPRGCTVIHTFKIEGMPPANLITAVLVTYMQSGDIKVEKQTSQVSIDDSVPAVVVPLTQQDTLAFAEKGEIEAQVRMLTTGGSAVKCTIIVGTADRVLNQEVLSG